jgi:hypothetical protein
MMPTFDKVRTAAAGQIGYNGTGTNAHPHSKFGEWYGIDPAWWCAMFISWCFASVGGPLNIETRKGFAYCPAGSAYFRRLNRWHGRNTVPKPGDLVFFDFDGVGEPHHVGLVESASSTQHIVSIQGNTDDPSIGRHGNCTRRKTHSNKYVFGYGRPSYGAAPLAIPPHAPVARTYKVVKGDTLSVIALRLLGNARRWPEISTLNRLTDPDRIYVGQVLKIPPR